MIEIIILLALIDSYSEVLRLIETQRWGYWVTWIPSWGMNWGNKWYKIFDSFHLLPGLFKNGLLVFALLGLAQFDCQPIELAFLLIHIWGFWWIRNIGMHIIWMRKEYRRWKYLSPIVF